jgi:hypothetical protein
MLANRLPAVSNLTGQVENLSYDVGESLTANCEHVAELLRIDRGARIDRRPLRWPPDPDFSSEIRVHNE